MALAPAEQGRGCDAAAAVTRMHTQTHTSSAPRHAQNRATHTRRAAGCTSRPVRVCRRAVPPRCSARRLLPPPPQRVVVSRAPSAADTPLGRPNATQGAHQSSHMVVAAVAKSAAAMSGAGGGRRETKHDGARHPHTAATLAQPQKYHGKHWKALMNLQRHAPQF